LIDLKTRAVAPFSPDARTFHNIYKLQKHALLRHQSYLIVFMGKYFLGFQISTPGQSLSLSISESISGDKQVFNDLSDVVFVV
jgi:hypothetical protein